MLWSEKKTLMLVVMPFQVFRIIAASLHIIYKPLCDVIPMHSILRATIIPHFTPPR